MKKKFGFKDTKSFFSFIKNINLLPAFFSNKEVSFYKKIKVSALIFMTVGYFFMPLDIIPDFFFGIGFVEDAIAGYFLIGKVNEELEIFKNTIYNKEKFNNHSGQNKSDENIIDVEFKEL